MMIASCYRGTLCRFAFAVLLVCGFGGIFVVVVVVVVFFWGVCFLLGGVERQRLAQGVKKSGQEAKPLNRASSNRSLNIAGLKKETLESVPASSENKYAPVKIARLAIFENPVMAGTDSLFFLYPLLIPAAGLCPSAKVRAPRLCPVTPGPSAPLRGISAA